MITSFPFFKQYDTKDCAPTCLRMILAHYRKNVPLNILRDKCEITRNGVSLLGLEKACEFAGFETLSAMVSPAQFFKNHSLPCIVHWNQDHFVVVYRFTSRYVFVADPANGKVKYSIEDFILHWIEPQSNGESGVALFLQPTDSLIDIKETSASEEVSLRKLYASLLSFKGLFVLLLSGIVLGAVLQLIFPFLTKAILDVGVREKSLYFIFLVLTAQLVLFLGTITIDFIRRWVLLFMSTRINLRILTSFLQKLMKLPISFFDTKHVGDMMQRLNDHNRIETFLTSSSISSLFSSVTLLVFGSILCFYNISIFFTFLIGSVLYVIWVSFFLQNRKRLDILRFELQSKNHSKVVELIGGMQDIKLNNVPNKKRWEWEQIQAGLFALNTKILRLNQLQEVGGNSINQLKNIIITFLSVKGVIEGTLTMGEMLAVQYVIGQMNSPVEQLMGFMQSGQDARLSMQRLNEVHQMEDEETGVADIVKVHQNDLLLKNVNFTYSGTHHTPVLRDINLELPAGKVTAIVGASGSGKTTLLKLLLMIYRPDAGEIFIGEQSQDNTSHSKWRARCGTVLQDGYIFSDSIASNIALDENETNQERLRNAAVTANIHEFIEQLPLGYQTIIGNEGSGLSQGQKQRILIARAVYRDPDYIFFDEATNALDAANESTIMKNLHCFFAGRTVVIVAHRLSTVRNADQIVVLNKGVIVEKGSHQELVQSRGYYYKLIKDQLELGN